MFATNGDTRHNVPKLGTILCGFVFKPKETIGFLESKGVLDQIIKSFISNYTQHSSSEYNKKVV